MQITLISQPSHFEQIKTDWKTVLSADNHATIFQSWAWLHGWQQVTPLTWMILTGRPDISSPFVAFLPLAMNEINKFNFTITKHLYLGGNNNADHTAFLSLSDYVNEAIPAFAHFIKNRLQWDTFYMGDVSDPRLDKFLECFKPHKYKIITNDTTPCPYIALPDTWEQYLEQNLTKRHRKNLQYNIRRLQRSTKFHVTQAQTHDLENHIETFIRLFQIRWRSVSEQRLRRYRLIFRSCFEDNTLWLNIFWDDTTPIAAMAALTDQEKKTFSYYNGGYNTQYAKLSPGKVMIAHSIKYAIQHEFRIYDFLRGDEDYKYSFGATDSLNQNITIQRKNMKNYLLSIIRKTKSNLNR